MASSVHASGNKRKRTPVQHPSADRMVSRRTPASVKGRAELQRLFCVEAGGIETRCVECLKWYPHDFSAAPPYVRGCPKKICLSQHLYLNRELGQVCNAAGRPNFWFSVLLCLCPTQVSDGLHDCCCEYHTGPLLEPVANLITAEHRYRVYLAGNPERPKTEWVLPQPSGHGPDELLSASIAASTRNAAPMDVAPTAENSRVTDASERDTGMEVVSSDDDTPIHFQPVPPAADESSVNTASRDLERYHMAVISAEAMFSSENKEQSSSVIHEIRAGTSDLYHLAMLVLK